MSKLRFAALLLSCILPLSFQAHSAEKTANSQPAVEQSAQVANVPAINLNTADAATLEAELAGVGKAKAQAIIDHRTSNGPFASVDELLEVKGIGPAILEKNRARLSIN